MKCSQDTMRHSEGSMRSKWRLETCPVKYQLLKSEAQSLSIILSESGNSTHAEVNFSLFDPKLFKSYPVSFPHGLLLDCFSSRNGS